MAIKTKKSTAASKTKKVEAKKPVSKKAPAASTKKDTKKPVAKASATKKPVAKAAPTKKPVAKAKEAPKKKATVAVEKDIKTKVYHISKRKEDNKWQVRFASGEKALKLFNTQGEAIEFAKAKAKNQDGAISIHKKDGKIRKQKY